MQEDKQSKGTRPTPKVSSFLICENVIIDGSSQQKTLMNLVDQISAPGYPTLCPRLFLFIRMGNGHGTHRFAIKLLHANTDEEIKGFQASEQIAFPDPLKVLDWIVQIPNLILEKSGEYRFQLYCDDKHVVEQRLTANILDINRIDGNEHDGD